MSEVAVKKNKAKWAAAKRKALARMGGKHSARAMQLATKIYKESGGKYSGKKSSENRLSEWSRENED